MRRDRVVLIIALFAFLALLAGAGLAQEDARPWPHRVLITNDNGIDDVKIVALARAFAPVAETYVVAPLGDRSGSGSYMPAIRQGKLRVERRHLGEGIEAYAVDGSPADCMLVAITGIMQDNPPDLVVSGINGGPNLGSDWFGSGTVGAARVAAFGGFPAVAVSGLDDDLTGAVEAATQWVVRLARSPVVRELRPPRYLTVSIPRIEPEKIRGIRVAERCGLARMPAFTKVTEASGEGGSEVWQLSGMKEREYSIPSDSDVALYQAGYVVVVPMRADEHDRELLSRLKESPDAFPKW